MPSPCIEHSGPRCEIVHGCVQASPPASEGDEATECELRRGSSEASTEPGSEAPWSPDEGRPACTQPCENLIIFDWDDTLFPTTWLQERGALGEGAWTTPEQDAQLDALADLVAVTLETAKRRGGVAIVTNAQEGWLEMSCEALMPSLQPHLAGVRIISARSRYEKRGLYEPTTWKCFAFEDLVGEVFGALGESGVAVRRNIVSIGDSEHEMKALKWVGTCTECNAKYLRLMRRPSLEQLVMQHEQIAAIVDDVVDHDGNLGLIGVES
jgi:phosphoglycolate phosphatase-like HAD superfamily hydrolase